MTAIDSLLIERVVKRVIQGNDYRIEVLKYVNEEFLKYTIEFFKRIVDAKLKNTEIDTDWYKSELLSSSLSSNELIIHSGLNKKTISNMYNSARREIVIEATNMHYDLLYDLIDDLIDNDGAVDITLTIKFNKVSVDLNINESLIVINSLAVKRSQLKGGAYSSTGKKVEKVLMLVLCKLYSVPENNYELRGLSKEGREIDFFLIDLNRKKYRCEVKLMGKGNPESADSVYPRDSNIFVADKISDLAKSQLPQRGIKWVELRDDHGYERFESILIDYGIPYVKPSGDIEERLDELFTDIQTIISDLIS